MPFVCPEYSDIFPAIDRSSPPRVPGEAPRPTGGHERDRKVRLRGGGKSAPVRVLEEGGVAGDDS